MYVQVLLSVGGEGVQIADRDKVFLFVADAHLQRHFACKELYVCMYVCMYMYMYDDSNHACKAFVYVCMYICMYVCMCKYMNIML